MKKVYMSEKTNFEQVLTNEFGIDAWTAEIETDDNQQIYAIYNDELEGWEDLQLGVIEIKHDLIRVDNWTKE